jgi:CheY-like chemotaxis protein
VPVILVVEDEAPNRALVRAILDRAAEAMAGEPVVLEATDLATARTILAARRVDLVLLDVRLPDGNGLDLARELHKLPASARPRVVVLSASVLPADVTVALRSGADRFVGKPFRPDELTREILDLVP